MTTTTRGCVCGDPQWPEGDMFVVGKYIYPVSMWKCSDRSDKAEEEVGWFVVIEANGGEGHMWSFSNGKCGS